MSTSAIDPSISTVQARQNAEKAKDGLNGMDFMKLLVAQLTNQDPLSPMEDMDFTGQIAQLQALQEQIKMTEAMQQMRTDSQMQTGAALIGKEVTGIATDRTLATGIVVNVIQKDDDVFVELHDGRQISVGNISRMTGTEDSIADRLAAAANAVGMWIQAGSGDDRIQGIVSSVIVDNGRVMLQLYGGQRVAWDDINFMRLPTDNDVWYTYPDEIREQIEQAESMLRQAITGINDKGEEVSGIMADATLRGDDVYIILYNGEEIKLENVKSRETPKAEHAEKDLVGKWVIGLDEEGNTVEGYVTGAEDREDGLCLILEDGKHLYYDFTGGIFDKKPESEDGKPENGGDAGEIEGDE